MKTMIAAGKFCKRRELAKELNEYSKNIFETEKLLQKFEFHQEMKRTGMWLSIEETKQRASNTLKNLLDSNLIQNGVIVPGIKEYLLEQIA